MTANQLRQLLADNFGIDKKWPESLIVDAETYVNCCIDVFEKIKKLYEFTQS